MIHRRGRGSGNDVKGMIRLPAERLDSFQGEDILSAHGMNASDGRAVTAIELTFISTPQSYFSGRPNDLEMPSASRHSPGCKERNAVLCARYPPLILPPVAPIQRWTALSLGKQELAAPLHHRARQHLQDSAGLYPRHAAIQMLCPLAR